MPNLEKCPAVTLARRRCFPRSGGEWREIARKERLRTAEMVHLDMRHLGQRDERVNELCTRLRRGVPIRWDMGDCKVRVPWHAESLFSSCFSNISFEEGEEADRPMHDARSKLVTVCLARLNTAYPHLSPFSLGPANVSQPYLTPEQAPTAPPTPTQLHIPGLHLSAYSNSPRPSSLATLPVSHVAAFATTIKTLNNLP